VLPSPYVIFTDLDGTLLDHHSYSWAAAEEALEELERRRIPLVFVTSKTRAEVEDLRRKLGNAHPFITENGGGVFIPHGYFAQRIEEAATIGRYHCLALARPYEEVVALLEEIAGKTGASVVGFHNLSAREIAQNTGLSQRQAELARERDFDEPFFFAGASEQAIEAFVREAGQRGAEVARGGRFWHLAVGSDKGRAVRRLLELYRESRRARVRSVALGDSPSDLPMLAAVDRPILLPRQDAGFDAEVLQRLPRVARGAAPGPEGWNQAVGRILAAD